MQLALARNLDSRLAEYGLTFAGPVKITDLEPELPVLHIVERGADREEFAVVFAPAMTMTTVDSLEREHGNRTWLLLGSRINERSAEMFRKFGVRFLDQLGNAYLEFGNVLIDVRGRKPETPSYLHENRKPSSGMNLFSPKRAQVIFALLCWPELANAPVRELAFAAGVSIGQAQGTLGLLHRHGYIDGDKPTRIRTGSQLFERWALAYPSGLGSPRYQQGFHGNPLDLKPISGGGPLYISGEAAAEQQLRPETLTIYAEALDSALIAKNRWRRDAEPNIFVRKRFWKVPGEDELPEGVYHAPDLIIYADLLASQESRQVQAAQSLRNNSAQLRQLR